MALQPTQQALARHGETLDALCWRVLGTTGTVEAVLEMNPGLAAAGPLLVEGTVVILPPPAPALPAARETVNLWN